MKLPANPTILNILKRGIKQGFRHVFGNTVFGYLHDYQMQQAQRLLLEEKMTVGGVAGRVGYASPTSFCAAFRRKFGITPQSSPDSR